MNHKFKAAKTIPIILVIVTSSFFIFSFFQGKFLIKKNEKEIKPKSHISESQAKIYELKEIDSKTGFIRWEITAKEGNTGDNLQSAYINDIKAKIYKDKKVVFEITAPRARANLETKEILLLDKVVTKDKNKSFVLKSKELSLGKGTSLEAHKGFILRLKDNGTIIGESVFLNDDQSKISITELKSAALKDITISGKTVNLEKDKKNQITQALVKDGGTITLKNNDVLSAQIIHWSKSGKIEAKNNVVFTSNNKIIHAEHVTITPEKEVTAKNKVQIVHKDTQCYGELLTYKDKSLITITGNPKAIQGNKTVTADKILYNVDSNELQAIGKVKTKVEQDA